MWSVAIEWHIYFVFPLLLILWRRLGLAKTLVLSIVLAITLSMLIERFWFWEANLLVHYIGLFALGMGASIAVFSSSSRSFHLARRVPWATVTPLATLAICALSFYYVRTPIPLPLIDTVIGAWAALLLLHLSLNGGGILQRVLDWQPLVFIGSFPYSLYAGA